jgi:hypothetical protein
MKYAFLCMLALTSAAFADDPFSCVDPDVADAFLGNAYQGRGEYSNSVPTHFVALNVPTGFSLVASKTLDAMSTVIYKSDMDSQPTLTAAVDALTKVGWTENSQQRRQLSGGFQTHSRPSAAVLCHDDDEWALSVIVTDQSDSTFVSYVQHSASQSCGATPDESPHHDPSEMMSLVPTLNLPQGAKATNSGMGGNGHEVSSHVDISGAVGRSELMTHFEDQIRQQGWEYQTNWSSHLSSGSVWALDTVEDGVLIGTLHVFDSGVGPMRVRLSVNPADPRKGKGRGSWSGSTH